MIDPTNLANIKGELSLANHAISKIGEHQHWHSLTRDEMNQKTEEQHDAVRKALASLKNLLSDCPDLTDTPAQSLMKMCLATANNTPDRSRLTPLQMSMLDTASGKGHDNTPGGRALREAALAGNPR